MIRVSEVSKRFGTFLALDRVSFQVDQGRVVGFLGLNGAGKTTTLRILSCFHPPTSGNVSIGGFDTVRQSDQVRQEIGYLPERVPLYEEMRVQEYLRFRGRLKGVRGSDLKPALERVISRCGLNERERSIIGNLSKGYRQRVGLADALIHDPKLLLLDEPTSGLDPDQRIEVRSLIRDEAESRTVLLSTHILPEAEAVCDDVIIIHKGRIRASGNLQALQAEEDRGVTIIHEGPVVPELASQSQPRDDGSILLTSKAVADTARLVSQVVSAGRGVAEVRPDSPTLEQTFIRLTTGREDHS